MTVGFMSPEVVATFSENKETRVFADQVVVQLAKVAKALDPDFVTCDPIPANDKIGLDLPSYKFREVILEDTDMDDVEERCR